MNSLSFPEIGAKAIHYQVVGQPLILEQWRVPIGTTVTLYQTANFGWVVLPEGCLDMRGFTIPKRAFKM